MVKISVQSETQKFELDLENLDITIEDLKKKIEESLNENVRIPADKQVLYSSRKKLVNGKKLSDFIDSEATEIKIFVMKEFKSEFGSSTKKTSSTNSSAPKENSANASFGSNPQAFGQQPFPYAYGSPHAQPQGQFNSPMGAMISKEQIDLVLNNPQILDQMIDMQSPGLSQDEREKRKAMYKECFKILKNDPALMNNLNSAASDILRGAGAPPGYFPPPQQPGYGYSPQMGQYPQMHTPPPGYYPYYPPPYHNPMYAPPYYYPNALNPNQPQGAENPEFKLKLKALQDMGFNDEKENTEALTKAGGDLNLALDFLKKPDPNFRQD